MSVEVSGWTVDMTPAAEEEVSPLLVAAPREAEREEYEEERFDICSSIQKEKQNGGPLPPTTYTHPPISRMSSPKSLEICTESLGSETGSEGFTSDDELNSYFSSGGETEEEEEGDVGTEEKIVKAGNPTLYRNWRKELSTVNYNCFVGCRQPVRSFPPPLSSISLRGTPYLKMMPRRSNGRLVVEAVPVVSQNYLHAERHGGRLLLSFIDASTNSKNPPSIERQQLVVEDEEDGEDGAPQEAEEAYDAEMLEEEEVEVVDRGTIVEVKVSTQPQTVSGATAIKFHRSSLVINKFVVGSPLTSADDLPHPRTPPTASAAKKTTMATTTATAAAVAVAASSMATPTSTSEGFQSNYLQDSRWGPQSPSAADAKLLFASRSRSREELFHDMRRCSELRRPLFIFEQPCCIATSS